MAEGYTYTATTGNSRIEKREVVRYSATKTGNEKQEKKRLFVPFAGFDGQALAGKGALVFEGELLELRN